MFSSVAQSCPTLCDPIDCSTPVFPVHHQLLELTQIHVHCIGDAVSSSVIPFSSHLQSFPASGSFPISQFFASGGQSIEASAPASVLPMNIQGWFHLELKCFHLLTLQGMLKSLFQQHNSKASVLPCWAFFMVQFSQPSVKCSFSISDNTKTFLWKVYILLWNK